MKLLFVFCEGPHDAQLLARLLEESGQYQEFDKPLKGYPKDLSNFFIKQFQSNQLEEIRLHKPSQVWAPVCAWQPIGAPETFILPIAIHGIGNMPKAREWLLASHSLLAGADVPTQEENRTAALYIYDADSAGKRQREDEFAQLFQAELPASGVQSEKWYPHDRLRLAQFIWTADKADSGTLEDLIWDKFKSGNEELAEAVDQVFSTHFPPQPEQADPLAYQAKRYKGMLNTCGQMNPKTSGASLAVVIRNTPLLDGKFKLEDNNSQEARLLSLVQSAFP